jgi:hypothetical protein
MPRTPRTPDLAKAPSLLEGSSLVPELPADEHEEELIDEALTETFPASDPIAVAMPGSPIQLPDGGAPRSPRGIMPSLHGAASAE